MMDLQSNRVLGCALVHSYYGRGANQFNRMGFVIADLLSWVTAFFATTCVYGILLGRLKEQVLACGPCMSQDNEMCYVTIELLWDMVTRTSYVVQDLSQDSQTRAWRHLQATSQRLMLHSVHISIGHAS